jgi:hypothetical protein
LKSRWWAAPTLLLLLSGCAAEKHPEAQRGVSDYFVGDYRSARDVLRPLAAKTDEDYVLNNVRLRIGIAGRL